MTSKHRMPARRSWRLPLLLALPLAGAVAVAGVQLAGGDASSEDGTIALTGSAVTYRGEGTDVAAPVPVGAQATGAAAHAVVTAGSGATTHRRYPHGNRSTRWRPTRTTTSAPTTTSTTVAPTVTRPTVTIPTVTQPTVTKPTVTQPTVTQPTVTQPTVTQPTVTGPTTSTSTRTVTPTSSSTVSQPPVGGSFADQVVALTNQQRVANGCQPLAVNGTLTSVAQAHSVDMAARNFFDHNNPDGKSPFDRMSAAGYTFRMAAENIAAGQPTPQSVVDAWMNSSGHRANILNCGLTQIGVGYATGGSYRSYWTQDFGTPMN